MVLVTGLEPVRYCYRGILSPLRLPISPHQQIYLQLNKSLYIILFLPFYRQPLRDSCGTRRLVLTALAFRPLRHSRLTSSRTASVSAVMLPISPHQQIYLQLNKSLYIILFLPFYRQPLRDSCGTRRLVLTALAFRPLRHSRLTSSRTASVSAVMLPISPHQQIYLQLNKSLYIILFLPFYRQPLRDSCGTRRLVLTALAFRPLRHSRLTSSRTASVSAVMLPISPHQHTVLTAFILYISEFKMSIFIFELNEIRQI